MNTAWRLLAIAGVVFIAGSAIAASPPELVTRAIDVRGAKRPWTD
jgi:hypothetical protein